jgi:putative ABC transport system substrate-binding protein
MNRRRSVIACVALAALGGLGRAGAQSRAAFRIGVLPSLWELRREQFVDAMRQEGWLEKREFVLVDLGLKYGSEIDKAADRMVNVAPDLILTATEAYAAAAHRLTTRIPIVMWVSGYPVERGVARSLARPGKNVTGSSNYAGTGIWGKLLELLRDTKPGIQRVGILWDYLPPAFQAEIVASVQAELRRDIASALGLTVHIVDVTTTEGTAAAVDQIYAQRPDALFVTAGPILSPVRSSLARFAIEKRLPLISDSPWPQIEPQTLLTYSASPVVLMRQAAAYVVRILRDGAKPGELPIQQPARFELIVNLQTAKAIGVTVPPSILLRADRVIE